MIGKKTVTPSAHHLVRLTQQQHPISRKQLSRNALKILYQLNEAGYEAYLVGGCIRDLLLGLTPKDFDIATSAHPEEVAHLFKNCRLIGRRFRLAHVYFHRDIIEVATFRSHDHSSDRKHNDRGFLVRDNVYGSIEEDAFRRDFTINALYYDAQDGSVKDFTGGLQDLKKRSIRLIGDPVTRLQEDPVRMLRAVRIAAKLDFNIDKAALAAFKASLPLLSHISPSRLFDEVIKMFKSGKMLACYHGLMKQHLFTSLFPQTYQLCRQYPHLEKFVLAAFANTDARIQAGKSTTPIFLFAVLLWPPLMALLKTVDSQSQSLLSFFHETHKTIFQAQNKQTQLTKFITEGVKEIWLMQFYLENLHPRFIWRSFSHPRFRAAYDFYLLRAEQGLADKKIADWWTTFQEEENAGRKALIDALAVQTEHHCTVTKGLPA